MTLKSSLTARGLAPQKKFGQHFLTDARILARIADAAEISARDVVLEIGPGLGHLTRALADKARIVVAVEVDRGLAQKLQEDFAATRNVRIVCGDVLERAPAEWLAHAGVKAADFKLVANLPYYITSAVLRYALEAALQPRVIVVTVQREVAARMIAQPPEMSLLALSVQYYARARVIRKIPAGAFYPRPKVDSAVVRLDVIEPPRAAAGAAQEFFEIARAGFSGRRKQLRNALMHALPRAPRDIERALTDAQIDPTRRAETLTIAEWESLARALNRAD